MNTKRGYVKGSLVVCLLAASGGLLLGQEVPKADLFFGYSFVRYNSAQTIPAFTANGGIGTFAWNFNDHIAVEAELGGYHNGNVNNWQFDTTTFSYLFGPRLSYGRSRRVNPYVHVLFGGQYATTSISADSVLVVNPYAATAHLEGNRYKANTNAFAMAAGGGLDIKLSRHVVLRPIQLDYLLTRFEAINVTVPPGESVPSARNQNNLRYAAGVAFLIGGEKPTPPKHCPDGSTVPFDQPCPKMNMTLGANPSEREVCPGTVVKIMPSGVPNGATVDWTVNGEPAGHDPSLDFATVGRPAGDYRIGLKATAAGYNDGSAETTVTVRAYQPPSGTLAISPSEVWVGEKATLSPNFTAGTCGGPLQPATFSATEGSIVGDSFDSSTVSFDPSDNSEQRKTITVTAMVSDGKGTGSAQAQVVVKKKAVIVSKRLPDVIFPKNNARVNNCGKRVLLEELKTYTDADPTGTVVFVGHEGPEETVQGLDMERAMNAAAVISAGTGICSAFPASQISVSAVGTEQVADFQPYFCGTSADVTERRGQMVNQNDANAKLRRVEVWFVPTNGKPPHDAKNPQNAATAGVAKLGCPR